MAHTSYVDRIAPGHQRESGAAPATALAAAVLHQLSAASAAPLPAPERSSSLALDQQLRLPRRGALQLFVPRPGDQKSSTALVFEG